MPLAPIAFLKEIADLYDLPNDLIRRSPSFQLDPDDANQKTLQLHLWIACVIGRTDYILHEIISSYNSRRNKIGVTPSPTEPNSTSTPSQPIRPIPIRFSSGPQHTPEHPPIPSENKMNFHRHGLRAITNLSSHELEEQSNSPQPNLVETQSPKMNAGQITSAINTSFKDRLFGGSLEESITNILREFDRVTNQLQLDAKTKASFLPNILKEPASTFYSNNIHEHMSFKEACIVLRKEYDSMDRQREAQLRLDNLRMTTFMMEHEITQEDEGLLRLCAYIDKLNPQCTPLFRNETCKLKVLSSAVAPYPWVLI